jgi:PPM family protein phosphatase
MIIDYYGMSETGPIREDNQDSIHLPDQLNNLYPGILFGVADGMGGFSHGGLASALALEALYTVYSQNGQPKKIQQTLNRGIEAANLAVVNEAHRLAINKMGTTLTALVFDPLGNNGTQNKLHIAHIGDSRAYLIRNGKVECLTNDHTVVGDLLRMRVITQDQVRTHARRSILTRAIGLALFIQPEFTAIQLHEDDRILLCTDGLWAAIHDEEFSRISHNEMNMENLCKNAINQALENGSDDNLSIIAIHVKTLPPVKNGKANPSWLQRIFSSQNSQHD